ncbi:MAG: hypothetical protein K8I82_08865 [Anaerolineae bacterium]|nr:hypothetical protein [Anaerolineae bacterium]
MNTCEIVNEFHRLGYSLSLDGNNIRFKFTGQGVPLRGDVQPLLDFLRQNKSEVIAFLRQAENERFSNAFGRAVGEMSREYKSGFFDRARRQCPERYSRFGRAEDRINRFWDAGDFAGFREELREWRDIYQSLLALFKNKNPL